MNKAYFQTMARYNRWANATLYDALEKMPAGEWDKDRPAFFGSMKVTMNHILGGSRAWVSRIEGSSPKFIFDEVHYHDLDALRGAQESFDQEFIDLVDGMSEARIVSDLSYTASAGDMVTPMPYVLAHLINHATHHRGQVHDMMTQTEIKPPQLDLIYFIRAEGWVE